MNEENALLAGDINVENLETMTAELKIADKTFKFNKIASPFEFTVPIKDISVGDYSGTFALINRGNKMMETKVKLRKLEFNEQNTPIDHRVRAIVVNGKPRIIVAPFGERNTDFEDMQNMVDVLHTAGFEFWMPGFHIPDEKVTHLAKISQEKNINLIVWMYSAWKNRKDQDWQIFCIYAE